MYFFLLFTVASTSTVISDYSVGLQFGYIDITIYITQVVKNNFFVSSARHKILCNIFLDFINS